ncbi:MAG: cell division topological specificity factor MinE, partial [Alphaproteobacteria bacterium]
SFFNRRGSASVARDRLRILLAHERTSTGRSDLVGVLREEILAAIRKHIEVEPDKVHVKMNPGRSMSTLEIGVEIPTRPHARAQAA